MWQIMAQQALDIARERGRDAAQHRLAAQARAARDHEARIHGLARPSRARSWAASSLRAVSGALGTVADAACDAAARVEHRTA
jgi:hypothetical protein